MRRIALSDKKIRGIPRRLRSLAEWSASFDGAFPTHITQNDRYYNYKIPVDQRLVEGEQATQAVRQECAQRLIDACSNLIRSKPKVATTFHVVAAVCLPDMFTSEVCIYTDESYFLSHTQPSSNEFGSTTIIAGRSLAKEWSLALPPGIREHGVLLKYDGYEDEDDQYVSEHWFFGEVLP